MMVLDMPEHPMGYTNNSTRVRDLKWSQEQQCGWQHDTIGHSVGYCGGGVGARIRAGTESLLMPL